MRRGFALGLVGLVVALACDDAHKVGDDIGVGGRGGATGGNGGALTSLFGGAPVGDSAGGTAPTSTGGTIGIGGTAGAGAAGAGAAAGGLQYLDETCTWPTAQFEFTVDDPSAYCSQWVPDLPIIEIYDSNGTYVTYLNGAMPAEPWEPIHPRCPDCRLAGRYAAAINQSPMTGSLFAETWTGNREEVRNCSSQSGYQCGVRHCVSAGRYTARFCVAPKGSATTCDLVNISAEQLFPRDACVEVPFDFPTTEVVRGQITTPTMGGAGGAGPVGTGGTVSNGGAAGGPAIVDETCTRPAAQFEFTVDDPSKYCSNGYWGRGSIEILDGDGRAVRNLGPDVCSPVSCASCDRTYPAGTCVTIAPVQGDAGSTPLTEAWDGSFNLSGTCGNPSADCVAHQCVQPGRFRAKYCLAPKGNLSTCTELDPGKFLPATACVEVPFDFPTTEVIHGQITTPGTGGAGAGGAGGAGAGGAGAAGAPTCLPGCNLESKSSLFCPSERSYAWVCGASPNVSTQMLAAGCTDAATGAIRYCCPSTFQTQCQ